MKTAWEGEKVIKQEALSGTGEEREGNHESGRIKHIFLVSDFWDKGVPAFLSEEIQTSPVRVSVSSGNPPVWQEIYRRTYTHTKPKPKSITPHLCTPLSVPALVVSDPRGARGSV